MNKVIRFSMVVVLLGGLTACQTLHSTQQQVRSGGMADSAQPLGLGQQTPASADALAYLLLGQGPENHVRSQRACEALLEPLHAQAAPNIITYLPLDRVGDFSRTTPRFNKALCKHLADGRISRLERGLRSALGDPVTRGPYLVVVPQEMGVSLSLDQALVIDLSLVRDQDLPRTIHNWRQHVMPNSALWQGTPDVQGLYAALSQGLSQIQIAATAHHAPAHSL